MCLDAEFGTQEGKPVERWGDDGGRGQEYSATMPHYHAGLLRKRIHFVIKVSKVNIRLGLLLTSHKRGCTNLIILLVYRLVVSEIAPRTYSHEFVEQDIVGPA